MAEREYIDSGKQVIAHPDRARRLKDGDGGDTFDGMETRVKALEDKFDRIDAKLDSIVKDVSYLKGKLETAPSAQAFGELKGRVDSLPTTARVATLLGIAVALVTIITKWSDLVRVFSD